MLALIMEQAVGFVEFLQEVVVLPQATVIQVLTELLVVLVVKGGGPVALDRVLLARRR